MTDKPILLLLFLFAIGGSAVRNQSTIAEKFEVGDGRYLLPKLFAEEPIPRLPTRVNEMKDFPDDLFTLSQLQHGAIILHLFGALYSFTLIAIVCSNYFLPSIDCICLGLNLSQDVAAATFMSFATTTPELFTVFIGTFITKSDIGLGAVIGCGMFNILGVAMFAGLATVESIKLDWWPLLRDSGMYIVSLSVLVVVVSDGVVSWMNSLSLVGCYFIYFLIMVFNQNCRKLVKSCFLKFRGKDLKKKTSIKVAGDIIVPSIKLTTEPSSNVDVDKSNNKGDADDHQKSKLYVTNKEDTTFSKDEDNIEDDTSYKAFFINYDGRSLSRKSIRSERGSFTGMRISPSGSITSGYSGRKQSSTGLQNHHASHTVSNALNEKDSHRSEAKISVISLAISEKIEYPVKEEEEEMEFTGVELWHPPEGTIWKHLFWYSVWPATFIFYITVPDCRVIKWRKYYPLTFCMCVFWIGVINYFGNWMMSTIGNTMGIPDSVMGLTFLAAAGSMPEAVSIIIMARQGEGGLGFSNSLGGNTMGICLCLGLPWVIQTSIGDEINLLSGTLHFDSMALYFGILVLLCSCAYTKFMLNKKMGLICLIFYLIFIVTAVLLELKIIPS